MKQRIETLFPAISVQLVPRESRGDQLAGIPLHTVAGSDFFTRDIFESLTTGDADIAVHSLKDMSSEHFFGDNVFAVVDRDDTHDIAIFRGSIETKLQNGETIVIGTCSPRREEMATVFLQKALPQTGKPVRIETRSIRGNVETRLRKLDAGAYDATILATAGLNRLLSSETDGPLIRELLRDKKIMLLPLIECVPAPCQGAIVAEANPANERAATITRAINDTTLLQQCIAEKQMAGMYGKGCLQSFGVTTITYGTSQVIYAAGKNSSDQHFTRWTNLPFISKKDKSIFSTTDHMGRFFRYEYLTHEPVSEQVVYLANYKALPDDHRWLHEKKIWAAGTKTWFELAKAGLWVEGCADALGLEQLLQSWSMPLLDIKKEDVAIITNQQSLPVWNDKGWKGYASYELVEKESPVIAAQLKQADIIFWTSYRQFTQYRELVKQDVIHSCPHGETAQQLINEGVNPVVFPTIKAFYQWRQEP